MTLWSASCAGVEPGNDISPLLDVNQGWFNRAAMAHCIGKGTIRQTQMRRPTPGRRTMRRTSPINCARVTRRSFAAGAGAAGLLAATGTAFVVRAQSGPLKVGVLLPRSGAQPV